ncbi:flagellar biosynthesis protein FliR [Afifella sp. H1R]|uniref:flagellar biosynthesis protein FliR n=1 Tax=unclassified Afifella TaxID=2624128 RepID=UPI001F1A8B73|nr:flagellar biosynthesis protein FliR [Afifella sp. H1R]
MSELASETILAVFLIFCRIGGCLMLMPGFSSSRIPVQFRLFIAVAITLTLSPMLIGYTRPLVGDGTASAMLQAIVSELLIGVLIGLVGRVFFLGLQTIAVAVSQSIGLSAMPGIAVEEDSQLPTVASLFSLTAITIMFITDQHWLLLSGLIDSYQTLPAAQGFDAQGALINLTDQLSAVFFLVLRIGSPFLVYSIVINLAIGITNKLSPQIPVYFISMPFVTAGGLILLMTVAHEFLANFINAFGIWLVGG